MTRHEQRLAEAVGEVLGPLLPKEAVERLFDEGLIDRTACERRAIGAEVRRRTAQGRPLCEAMEETAERFCCSYGKVRKIVYETGPAARRRRPETQKKQ